MSAPSIKFSHRYLKLGVLGNRNDMAYTARLVAVQVVDLEDLHPEFLAYDTDNGRYELPKRGKYLLLLFHAVGGLFTTLRPAFPSRKEEYYRSKIGQEFDVVFVGEKETESTEHSMHCCCPSCISPPRR
jgi:hypothetical protein